MVNLVISASFQFALAAILFSAVAHLTWLYTTPSPPFLRRAYRIPPRTSPKKATEPITIPANAPLLKAPQTPLTHQAPFVHQDELIQAWPLNKVAPQVPQRQAVPFKHQLEAAQLPPFGCPTQVELYYWQELQILEAQYIPIPQHCCPFARKQEPPEQTIPVAH